MFGGILMVLMFLVALFLILLVLVQRGRGGGLAGALGGMGGQSAFGTKAGDLFTRITIVVASIWVVLCVLGVKYYNTPDTFSTTLGGARVSVDLAPGGTGATGGMTAEGTSPTSTQGDAGATTPATSTPAASTPAPSTPAESPAAPAETSEAPK